MTARSLMISAWAAACVLSGACGDDGGDSPNDVEDAGQTARDARVDDTADAGTGGDIVVAPALPDGQVVAPWDAYCIATFTSDFTVMSFFDDPLLEIQAGDRYLLGVEGFRERIIYITDEGARTLDVEYGDDGRPYSTNCGSTEERFGVFADTTVYEDAELTKPVCEVKAGQVLPKTATHSISLAGEGYEVSIGSLGSVCNGVSKGFVRAARVEIPGGGGSIGSPFIQFAAPKR